MAKHVDSQLQHCGNCMFRQRHPDDKAYCHRFPPAPLYPDPGVVTRYPQVEHDDWCGEYKREERRTPQ